MNMKAFIFQLLFQLKTFVPIKDFPHYLISPAGRIYNTRRGRFIHGSRNHHGYIYVQLRDYGHERNVGIHILVAEAFLIRRHASCIQVDHKDGIKTNNWSSNLEWVTPMENIHRAIHMGNHNTTPLWQAKHKGRSPYWTERYRRSGR